MTFQVGDIVKIREWDDMLEEYGLNEWGSIRCTFHFVSEMKILCGQRFKVVDITYEREGINYRLAPIDEAINPAFIRRFNYSAHMLKEDIKYANDK